MSAGRAQGKRPDKKAVATIEKDAQRQKGSKQRGSSGDRQVDVGVEKAMNLGKACISEGRTMAGGVCQAEENPNGGAAAHPPLPHATGMAWQAAKRAAQRLGQRCTTACCNTAAGTAPLPLSAAALQPPAAAVRQLIQKRSGVASAASGTCGVATGLSSVAWLARGPPERDRFTASSSL